MPVIITQGYNDGGTLTYPRPKVRLNHGNHLAINVWTKDSDTGKGVAMFDAKYIPPVGIAHPEQSEMVKLIRIFPNPCNSSMNITLNVKSEERIVVSLYNLFGQKVVLITDRTFQQGIQSIRYDASTLPSGMYLYNIKAGTCSLSGKLSVIKY